MSEVFYAYYKSPIGFIEVISTKTSVVACNFVKEMKAASKKKTKILNETLEQLDNYFRGQQKGFDLELELQGTDFQLKVWNKLQKIPFGKTITYKELAQRIGNKKAIRAVGNANGKNPVSIIVPCHRVIGSDGKLRGYGGGIEKKKWLIAFEESTITK